MKKLLLILSLMILVSTGCTKHNKNSEHPLVSGVQTKVLLKQSVDNFYTTSASIKSKVNSVVSAMVMGKVTSLTIQEGDRVKAGQLLLTIDSRDVVARIAGANARVRAAQMTAKAAAQNMNMAKKTYTRYKNLYEEKVITKQEFDQYTTKKNVAALEYKRAQAGIEQANARLGEIRVYQGYSKVTAPVSGVVIQKNIDLGSTAVQGQPLLTIENARDMELVANVDESYIRKIKVGQEATLKVGKESLKRKIMKIIPSIDPTTRTFKVKFDVTGLNNLNIGGQFVKISIPVTKKEVIIVPQTAIVKKGELTGVYKVDENNIISYCLIRVGETFGENVEVLSGLSDGDKIIITGVDNVIDSGKLKENNNKVKVNE